MAELTLRKIPFSTEAESRLRMLKARTGLDRNYICRMGFCLSLEEPGVPTRPDAKLNGGREIDRYTLLGQCARAYVSLLLVWMNKKSDLNCMQGGDIDGPFVAHMNRGVEIMASRVRSLADMASLLPLAHGARTPSNKGKRTRL